MVSAPALFDSDFETENDAFAQAKARVVWLVAEMDKDQPCNIGMLDSPYVRRWRFAATPGIRFEHRSLSVFRTFAQFQQVNPRRQGAIARLQ